MVPILLDMHNNILDQLTMATSFMTVVWKVSIDCGKEEVRT